MFVNQGLVQVRASKSLNSCKKEITERVQGTTGACVAQNPDLWTSRSLDLTASKIH